MSTDLNALFSAMNRGDVSAITEQLFPRTAVSSAIPARKEPIGVPAPTEECLQRFLSYVVDRESGCREWTAGTSEGYGTFTIDGRTYRAHRVAYRYFVGEIPEGLMILHSCDNRLCVNPDHLSAGTALDNTRDMIAKGRDKFASPPPPKEFCRNGHPYSEVGRYKTGACLQCKKEATHASYMRLKQRAAATADKSHVIDARQEGSPTDDAGTAGVVSSEPTMGDNGFASFSRDVREIEASMLNTQRLLREATFELNARQRMIEHYRGKDAAHERMVGKLLDLLNNDNLDDARNLVQNEYDAIHGPRE